MFATPAVAGNLVYVGSCGGIFYALDKDSGRLRWSYDTRADGPPAQFHGDPLITDTSVIVDTDVESQGHLYAFDRETGKVRWKQPLDGGSMGDVVRSRGDVVVLTMRGELVSFELATGRRNWTFDKAPRTPAGARPPGSPALAGSRLFFAARLGEVYALDAASGRLLWKQDLGIELNTSLTLSGDALYVAGIKGRIVKVSAVTGAVLAAFETGAVTYGTLVAAGECVIATQAVSEEGAGILTCLDPALAGIRWRQRAPRQWSSFKPLAWHGLVLTGSESGDIPGFRLTDGTEAFRLHVTGVVRGLGLAGDRVLLAGSLRGTVYAVALPEPSSLAAAPPRLH